MAKTRLDLQYLLEETAGTTNVYFQPPANYKLSYPCVVYKRTGLPKINADDQIYISYTEYAITVIDKTPDSEITRNINTIPRISMTTSFTNDNLYHDVFRLIY